MCVFSTPTPKVTAPAEVKAPQATPQESDSQVTASRDAEKQRRLRAANQTVMAGSQSLIKPTTAGGGGIYG